LPLEEGFVAVDDFRSTDALLDLVGQFYDCAVEPSGWPAALERLANVLDGRDVAITLNSISRPGFAMRANWNIDAEFEAAMAANYPTNPLLPAVWYNSVDEPFSLLGTLDEEELRKTTWYKNTVGAYGYRDAAISLLAKSSSQFGSLSVQRKTDQEPFQPADLALLRTLAPHIRRAVLIGDLLEARALARDTLSATLDLMNAGVVLTEADGKIVHANAVAERLLDSRNAMRRDGGELTARDAQSATELRDAIALAASGTTLDIPKSGLTVALKAADGRDLAAWVLPLDGGLRGDLGANIAARAAVFVRELGDTSPIPAELFVRRYGITAAECRVLLLIVQGMTLTEAAESLGISVATAKTHLSRLFHKTGTQRQAELVRLAMSALAPAST
jgi:DNA-binding CsgD family transcriptional regulator